MDNIRPSAADKPLHLRSKVTNGRRVFAIGGDGNSVWTRRWKDLVEMHASDLGGADYLSEAQSQHHGSRAGTPGRAA